MSTQSDPLRTTTQELPPDIIIAGDSWGCGEWSAPPSKVTHPGLELFLSETGYKVKNLSQGAASLLDTLHQIQSWCMYHGRRSDPEKPNDPKIKVFVFQTGWSRDFRRILPYCFTDSPTLLEIDQTTILKIISKWQYTLVHYADAYNLEIRLIGGASDTIWLDQFESEYPNLGVACQSMTNLCANDDDRIDDPVFEMDIPLEWFQYCKQHARSNESIKFLIDHEAQINKRNESWRQNPQWFAPDHMHGNRQAHQKLFDLLKSKKVI